MTLNVVLITKAALARKLFYFHLLPPGARRGVGRGVLYLI